MGLAGDEQAGAKGASSNTRAGSFPLVNIRVRSANGCLQIAAGRP